MTASAFFLPLIAALCFWFYRKLGRWFPELFKIVRLLLAMVLSYLTFFGAFFVIFGILAVLSEIILYFK
jgi:hypothetical protein